MKSYEILYTLLGNHEKRVTPVERTLVNGSTPKRGVTEVLRDMEERKDIEEKRSMVYPEKN